MRKIDVGSMRKSKAHNLKGVALAAALSAVGCTPSPPALPEATPCETVDDGRFAGVSLNNAWRTPEGYVYMEGTSGGGSSPAGSPSISACWDRREGKLRPFWTADCATGLLKLVTWRALVRSGSLPKEALAELPPIPNGLKPYAVVCGPEEVGKKKWVVGPYDCECGSAPGRINCGGRVANVGEYDDEMALKSQARQLELKAKLKKARSYEEKMELEHQLILEQMRGFPGIKNPEL